MNTVYNKSKNKMIWRVYKETFWDENSSYDHLVANIKNKSCNCYFNLIKHCQCCSVTFFYCVKHYSRNIMCLIFVDKISWLTTRAVVAQSSAQYLHVPDTFQTYTWYFSKKRVEYVKKTIMFIRYFLLFK